MTARVVSPRLLVYLCGSAVLMTIGVLTGRGSFVALGVPFGLAALVGTAFHPERSIEGRVHVERDAVAEGAEIGVRVEVEGPPAQVVEIAIAAPPGLLVVDGDNPVRLRLGRDGRGVTTTTWRAEHWGRPRLGTAVVRASDPLGLVAVDHVLGGSVGVGVRPGAEPLATVLQPARTLLASGNHPARIIGPGIEFAGVRRYQTGDRARDLNWRAGARRDALMVTQRNPERSADVILFVDTFAAEGLDETVRAAVAVALHQLAERDRVGLVIFGGAMQFVRPGTGSRQFHRIGEALLDVRPIFSWAAKEIGAIPPRMLPVGASILAITPLIDERAIGAIADLRRRRFEVGVVEVSPTRWTPTRSDEVGLLARRLWRMQREARRSRLLGAGVPVVEWREDVPLELVMRQLGALQRRRTRWLAS